MFKRIIALLVFLSIQIILFSQSNDTLYLQAERSIVYLQHEVYLDPSNCKKPELFTRLEKFLETEILDKTIPLATGSGIIIETDGTILTNRHVVQVPTLNSIRNLIADELAEGLPNLAGSNFTSNELDSIINDFNNMILKGDLLFTATVGNKIYYNLDIILIADQDEPDLAVVKIDGEDPFAALRLADSVLFNKEIVGKDVFSFGYPLGSVMDWLFEERIVTMNKGTISAFRDTELSLQHSAAISHGNSGGPLIDKFGTVIGINTAGLQEQQGNSLFYAIGADQVYTFLKDNGLDNILKWNARIESDLSLDQSIKYNVLGEIETSADLIIDAEKGAVVYLDGEIAGEAPLFLSIENSLTDLEIKGSSGSFSGKLRLLNSLSGTTSIKPRLKSLPFDILFYSETPGVLVFADNKELGLTPLEISLPADDYWFSFSKSGMYFEPKLYKLDSNIEREIFIDIDGEKAYRLIIEGLPEKQFIDSLDQILGIATNKNNKDPEFIFSSGNRKIIISIPDIYLPEGSWTLEIKGFSDFEGESIPVVMGSKGTLINLNSFRPLADITVRDLPDNTRIWVDGELFSDNGSNPLTLPVGKRDIFIWKKGFLPLDIDITVRQDNSAFITWQKSWGHDRYATAITIGSGLSIVSGAIVLGIFNGQWTNDYALSNSSNYEEYLQIKNTGEAALQTGTGLIVSGLIMGIPAIYKWYKFSQQQKILKTMRGW